MNILIPHTWLLEHLDAEISPKDLQEKLSLCGPSIEKIEVLHGDFVYDVEVTTNRVDSASIRGIAREAATILPEFEVQAKLKNLPYDEAQIVDQTKDLPALDLTIENDSSLCKRIIALSMKVDTVGESPDWLKQRLEQVGQRPLNNLIDITNYIMWDIGHPIHVFDLDRLTEKKIIVRQAEAGETFVTLDEKEHTCKGGEVVFDDGTGTIVDLPGIMGTANSVVTDKTKNILVWIESVPAALIRKASMGLAIRTQAAVLNEKHVDPTLGKDALFRAINMYQELAGGEPTSQIYDDWPVKPEISTIELSQELTDTYMGVSIKPARISRILRNLGCEVTVEEGQYKVTPPSYRAHDMQIKQDVIEEIARIYGYHNLPSMVMPTQIPEIESNFDHDSEQKIRVLLAQLGLNEVYSYSLISESQAKETGNSLTSHLKLNNPLSDDMVYLRTSLLPSHKEIFGANKAKKHWTIFEMANTYWKKNDQKLPDEVLELVISSNDSFARLKQVIDNLMIALRVENYQVQTQEKENHSEFEADLSGLILAGNTQIGVLGLTKLGFYAARIKIYDLIAQSKSYPQYIPIPSNSPIIEDITFKLGDKVNIGPVVESIKSVDALLTSVQWKDSYQQNHTFSLEYQDPAKQLTVESVRPIREKIVSRLKDEYKAELIGNL